MTKVIFDGLSRGRSLLKVSTFAVVIASPFLFLFSYAYHATGSMDSVLPYLLGIPLRVTPSEILLGEVDPAVSVELPLTISNHTSQPLTLLGFERSCGCLSLDEFPIVVKGQSRHVLVLRVRTPGLPGKFSHRAVVYTDVDNYSSVLLTISGSVR